ncbi:hypothetical protein CVV43_00370 [Candidatus Saccharibacteria bacterium HGW-Saccharibacteria-1]|nr:MAG: hypothetical protein CVV43_00370 [Candidatus Saccharibacteria bacterium HGW-Saccharibacteria-1]
MHKYYWLIAGVFVGIFTVLMSYININLIMASESIDDFSPVGIILVIAIYTVLIYLLSLCQKFFKNKK